MRQIIIFLRPLLLKATLIAIMTTMLNSNGTNVYKKVRSLAEEIVIQVLKLTTRFISSEGKAMAMSSLMISIV